MGSLVAVVAVLIPVGAVAAPHAKAAWVKNIKVSPTPFYADYKTMTVSFTTLRPAPSGMFYSAGFGDTFNAQGCAITGQMAKVFAPQPRPRGGVNARLTMHLYPNGGESLHFCVGLGYIFIGLIDAAGKSHPVAPPYPVRVYSAR